MVTPDGKISPAITGIPSVNSSGQGGLLGLTLDPDFSHNRMVYWVFSERQDDGNLTAVAKGRLSDDEKTIENAQVIYRATPAFKSSLHYGGRILFDSKGYIIFSTGERSDLASRPQAQFLNSSLGKIIRITKDGKPAPGNPFKPGGDARPELYSYGHRNVQGLALNPATGDLWETEFGPVAEMNSTWFTREKIMDGLPLLMVLNTVVRKSAKVFNRKMEWNNPFIIGILSYLPVVLLFIPAMKFLNGKIIYS